jgi:hypothetical protein
MIEKAAMSTSSVGIDVRAAIDIAKSYARDLFAPDGLSELALEEVEFDDKTGRWRVTVGFSRPWNPPRDALATITGSAALKRVYRVVEVDLHGEVHSVKIRSLNE